MGDAHARGALRLARNTAGRVRPKEGGILVAENADRFNTSACQHSLEELLQNRLAVLAPLPARLVGFRSRSTEESRGAINGRCASPGATRPRVRASVKRGEQEL